MRFVVKFDPLIQGELPWFASVEAESHDEARAKFEEAASGQLTPEYVATEAELSERLTLWATPTDDATDVVPAIALPMALIRRVELEWVRLRAAKLSEERGQGA